MRIYVTGAAGFVGQHVVAAAVAAGHEVVGLVREVRAGVLDGVEQIAVGDIAEFSDWQAVLARADAVVHLAARVHVMDETDSDPTAAYQRANVAATVNIAEAAAAAGVARFVFMSSIKVNGEKTSSAPFRRESTAQPVDPYGQSKLDAEVALRDISARSEMTVALLRPTVVYGVGVGGNIRRIIGAVRRGIPLPFGAINNRRTMVAVENLVVAVLASLTHPAKGCELFLIGDPEPVSTKDLVSFIARGLGRRPRLIPVPAAILRLGARALGRGADADRLLQDLVVVPDWSALGVGSASLLTPEKAFPALAAAVVRPEREV